MFAQGVCVADMAESLFETRIGKIIWPIYALVTIVITATVILCGKIISKVK